VIAREVVEPGTGGLAQLVEAFGEGILLPDGALNRPALAAKAFVDDEQRAKLNGIVHPLVGHRRLEIIEAVSDDAVVVEDIPLLVETGIAPMFPANRAKEVFLEVATHSRSRSSSRRSGLRSGPRPVPGPHREHECSR